MGQKCILVVEDEALIRLDTAATIADAGYRVIEAANGLEAKRLIEKGTAIDLVCTDVRMPGELDGIGLCSWIKEQSEKLPVIVVSGEITSRDIKAGVADCLLFKPVDHHELLKRIRGLLAN
jgi:DNA-binding response OmpR family regulator